MEPREDIRALETKFDSMNKKVDIIYYALMGNELAKDGGLVMRIAELEKDNGDLREKIERLERKHIKSDLVVKWLWAVGSAFITSLICNYFLKK